MLSVNFLLRRKLYCLFAVLLWICTIFWVLGNTAGFNIRSYAATISGSSAKGADFSFMGKVTTLNPAIRYNIDNTGTRDAAYSIQRALNEAGRNATPDNIYKIYIPAGTYRMERDLYVYSNTWICCDKNAYFKRCKTDGPLINSASMKIGGYSDTENIIVEGGTWDGNFREFPKPKGFSNVRFGHCNNILCKNMNIINNQNGHHLEIGGAKNVTVENCSFSGYTGEQDREAIQLDTMNSEEVFVAYEPFDDTSCENIVIRNNTFKDMPRAIGSHSATLGVYYRNILIDNNRFDNISGIAMIMYNYKNCTVVNNYINGCVSGIELKNMSGNPNANFHLPAQMSLAQAMSQVDPFSDTIIENNTINTFYNARLGYSTAIVIRGYDVKSDSVIPAFNFKISGVVSKNNNINTIGSGFTLVNADDCIINSNYVDFNRRKTNFANKNSINLDYCRNILIQQNNFNNTSQNGINITGGSKNQILNNSVTSPKYIGINVKTSSVDNIISGNSISNSGYHGIAVYSKSKAAISNNNVSRTFNEGSGIMLKECGFCSAAGNNIINTDKHGISAEKVSASITNNTVSGSGKNGITVSKNVNKNINLKNNNIINAYQFGLSITDNSKAYIENNKFTALKSKYNVSSNSSLKMPAVKSVKAVIQSDGSVKISFDKFTDNCKYEIFRKLQKESDSNFKNIKTVSALNGVDNTVAGKTSYVYKVRAFEESGGKKYYSEFSKNVSIITPTVYNINGASISKINDHTYTGKEIKPAVSLKINGSTLKSNDYSISYSSNKSIGKAKITIKGKGKYKGTKTVYFKINPEKAKFSKVISTKKTVSSFWSKVAQADKYEFMISSSKSFNGAKTISLNSGSFANTSKNLKTGQTYYVRVRAVKTVSKEKYTGAWSDVKSIKCK